MTNKDERHNAPGSSADNMRRASETDKKSGQKMTGGQHEQSQGADKRQQGSPTQGSPTKESGPKSGQR